MSRAIFLTGTDTPEAPLVRLAAGPLSAVLHDGALRHLAWNGTEVLRAVLFLVRTPGWGTPAPAIRDLVVRQDEGGFAVAYAAEWSEGPERVDARVRFSGDAGGRLVADAAIVSPTGFETNRTGFVVLHPLDGFADTDVEVEHASGPSETVHIPAVISPGQPLFDIRAVTHRPRPGLAVTTRFEGDVFEMEDHRNWSDASFKTYGRPIALPHPYRLAAGAESTQSITVTLVDEDAPAADAVPAGAPAATRAVEPPADPVVRIGGPASGRVPSVLIGLASRDAAAALPYADRLAALAGAGLVLRHSPAAGDTPADVAAVGRLVAATGLPVAFELILSDPVDPVPEIGRAAALLAAAGIAPVDVAAFHATDEASFQPGEPRPPVPTEAAVYAALRAAFPGVPAGGGSPAFFTEFNRKRPPIGTFDFVTHATAPTVHAADDRSVMETLEALPHIVRSARAVVGEVPHRVGPSGIGARLNPYGPGPVLDPAGERVGLAAADPRQRGLFAVAWHLGYAAALARLGVAAFAFGAPTGPFGLVSTPGPLPRPWWDDAPAGALLPLWHAARLLAGAAGRPLVAVEAPAGVAGLGWLVDGRRRVALANLGADPVRLRLEGLAAARVARFEADDVPGAATDPAFLVAATAVAPSAGLDIGPYGLVVLDDAAE